MLDSENTKIQTQILNAQIKRKITEIDLCYTAIFRPPANVTKNAGVFCDFDDIALIVPIFCLCLSDFVMLIFLRILKN